MAAKQNITHTRTTPDILEWISEEIKALETTMHQVEALSRQGVTPEFLTPADVVMAKVRLCSIDIRTGARLLVIGDMASECRATNARGAMLQLALAQQCVDEMLDFSVTDENLGRRKKQQAEQFLYSIMAFMESHFHIDRRDVVGGHFMGRHADPDFDLRVPEAVE